MARPYNRRNWVNGQPPFQNAQNLNAIEQGIVDVDTALATAETDITSRLTESQGDARYLSRITSIELWNVKPANSGATNRTNLISALTGSSATYYFPAGDYTIDNAAGPALIMNCSARLIFAPGARLIFPDNTKGALRFNTGTNLRLEGITILYTSNATTRTDEHALLIEEHVNLLIERASMTGPPGQGIALFVCDRPRIVGCEVSYTRSDGVHVANCIDAEVDGLAIDTTGDDGLAFLNYPAYADNSGGKATNITVRNCGARGITVLGQRGVEISNFYIDGTLGAGIFCGYESFWNGTGAGARVPRDVHYHDGIVKNAGAFAGYGHTQDLTDYGSLAPYGIYAQSTHTTIPAERISFSDIEVDATTLWGALGRLQSGAVTMRGIRIRNATGMGFNFELCELVTISDCEIDACTNSGIRFLNNHHVIMSDVTAKNTSTASSLNRAFEILTSNASTWNTQNIIASGLKIIDTQATPTGYVFDVVNVDASYWTAGSVGIVEWMTSGAMGKSPGFVVDTTNIERRYSGAQSSLRTAAPTAGWWVRGDRVYHSTPAASGNIGWVCTASGNPGTWKSFGTISA